MPVLTTPAVVLAVAFAGFAGVDWWAVATGRVGVERWAKPATLFALLGVAAVAGDLSTAPGRWLLAAVALGLVGDVFLLGEGEGRFVGGLSAFLLGHLAYAACFRSLGLAAAPLWLAGAAVVLVAALVLGRRILPSVHRAHGWALTVPVAAYMLVIALMLGTGALTGRPLVAVGAAVFVVSDTVLAMNRFVQAHPRAHLVVMVTYHVGQALIVAGVLAAA